MEELKSHETTTPVPLSMMILRHKLIVSHGFVTGMITPLGSTVIGNATFGRNTGTRQTNYIIVVVSTRPPIGQTKSGFFYLCRMDTAGIDGTFVTNQGVGAFRKEWLSLSYGSDTDAAMQTDQCTTVRGIELWLWLLLLL